MEMTIASVNNIWIRFFLETYFEFVISCLIGIRLKYVIVSKMNNSDILSQACAILFLVIIILFAIITTFVSLYRGS